MYRNYYKHPLFYYYGLLKRNKFKCDIISKSHGDRLKFVQIYRRSKHVGP